MDKAAGPAVDLVELPGSLDDPRALDGRRHRLGDILVIAFCTVLCGQEEFTAMARFGQQKEPWLRGFLALPAGIPSHDTFRAVLSALDAKQLAQTLIDWTEGVRAKLGGEIVAIDGKSARRSGSSARAALHLVNAWAVDNGLCLGQEQTGEKSNEITAVPLLLRRLELAGCIVTVDALNTQKDIAREVKEADAEYVLALKGSRSLTAAGSTLLGHAREPSSSRLMSTHRPVPSQYRIFRRVLRRLVNTKRPPWRGSSPRRSLTSACRPLKLLRRSHGSRAMKTFNPPVKLSMTVRAPEP